MKRRRSIAFTALGGAALCLCIFGSTKSFSAFDFSNSTVNLSQNRDSSSEDYLVKAPITPPQPRNKQGKLVCTKDRYVQDEQQVGLASWYGRGFEGAHTASGQRFDKHANTIAHLTLPMGTEVLVKNPETGAIVQATVNDCGPFVKNRIADLSYGVAKKLGIVDRGVGTVIITVL